MNKEEFKVAYKEVMKNLSLWETTTDCEYGKEDKEIKYFISKEQAVAYNQVMELLQKLNWEVLFTDHKELIRDDSKSIREPLFGGDIGEAVKIRPCGEKYGGKTYFGILIGDVAMNIGHSIKDGIVTASFGGYNPGIFIPELNKIIYGYESWWGKIESEEELDKLITDEVIESQWYVKLLKSFNKENGI